MASGTEASSNALGGSAGDDGATLGLPDFGPAGLEDASKMPALTVELRKRGYSPQDEEHVLSRRRLATCCRRRLERPLDLASERGLFM